MKKTLALLSLVFLSTLAAGCQTNNGNEITTISSTTELLTETYTKKTETTEITSNIETVSKAEIKNSIDYNFSDEYYKSVAASNEIDESHQYINKIKALKEDINKLNYINTEQTLTSEDISNYKNKITEFSSAVNDGYAQYSYSTHLSMVLFLSEDNEAVISTDDFLRTKRQKIYEISKQLIDTTDISLEDKSLSTNDISLINSIIEQLTKCFTDIEKYEQDAQEKVNKIINN